MSALDELEIGFLKRVIKTFPNIEYSVKGVHFEDGKIVRITFDGKKLRRYIDNTEDMILWVEDAEGGSAPIRVEFLREILKEFNG